jgi:hypothetical protein
MSRRLRHFFPTRATSNTNIFCSGAAETSSVFSIHEKKNERAWTCLISRSNAFRIYFISFIDTHGHQHRIFCYFICRVLPPKVVSIRCYITLASCSFGFWRSSRTRRTQTRVQILGSHQGSLMLEDRVLSRQGGGGWGIPRPGRISLRSTLITQ